MIFTMFKRKTNYNKVIWELKRLIVSYAMHTDSSTLKEFLEKVYIQLQERNLLDIHCNLLLVNKEYKDFFNRRVITNLFLSKYWDVVQEQKKYKEELEDIERVIQ